MRLVPLELSWAIVFGSIVIIALAVGLFFIVLYNQRRFIAAQREKMKEIEQSEEKFRTVVENSNDALFVIQNGRMVFINPTFQNTLGYSLSEVLSLNRDLLTIVDPAGKYLREEITNGSIGYELNTHSKSGEPYDFLVNLVPIMWQNRPAVLGSMHNITERKRMERQLRQAAKMEAIGSLAAGIAHDFNNMLTVINGNTELLMEDFETDSPERKDLEEIRKAGFRAAEMTRQLLAFSRRQIQDMRVINVNDVILNLEKMLLRMIRENVELVTSLNKNLGSVKADVNQMDQILLNLVINARDALPNGGMIKIETDNVTFDDEYFGQDGIIPAGSYVMLAVSDTGAGMDKTVQERIFEPYFTTKEKGKGTGLGLATVYGIVKQSEGYIWLYSEPDVGTTFKIFLPIVDAPAEQLKPDDQQEIDLHGSETIFVVEDEDGVRELAVRVLKSYGYSVLKARNGEEALALVKQGMHNHIDLLLTDVIMPGISGKKLSEKMSQFYQNLKILYMSGYSDHVIVHGGLLDKGINFIQKPFTPNALVRKLRQVLDTT